MVNPEDQTVDHLAFSLDWLMQNGIRPEECMLITARGDSMAPAISDGDLVMLDRRKTAITSGKIYVYNDPEDGTRPGRSERLVCAVAGSP
ncbi:S24 family peptidase [Salipiger marinus]|nr:S24 family peptidase [Salipiger marinus]